LYDLSNTLALYFDKNVPPRVPIIVIGHKEREQLIAFVACAKSGHPFVPVDDKLPIDRLEQIVHVSKAGLIVDPQEIRQILARRLPKRALNRVRGQDCFYIMFTSGSTGMPKGVMISIRNVEDFVDWIYQIHRFRQETFLNVAPFNFDLSVLELWCGLSSCSTIFSLSRRELNDPNRLFNSLRQSDATVWVSTPSFAQMALMNNDLDQNWMPRVRKFLFCGERLQHTTAAALLSRFGAASVYNMYGPTEATCAVTSMEIMSRTLTQYPTNLPVGFVRPGTKVTIDAETDEIHIRGRQVGLGYLRGGAGTHFYSVGGIPAYATGDKGGIDLRTSLLFVDGRLDRQVKVHGHRVELADVEENIMRTGLANDVVVGLSPRGRLVAAVLPLISGYNGTEELRKRLREFVPEYMVPNVVVFREELPLNENGKIDRLRVLEEVFQHD
jgi:D-alanine--poly(phosphoribitol) ligase subunit 1